MKRPVALLRCSLDKQDDEFHAQRASIQAYLDAKRLTVAPEDWRKEAGVHGDADKRPVLDRIREEAAAGTVSHVIAADFDRLGRAGEETLWIVRQLVKACGVIVVIARYPEMDLRTVEARLMLHMMSATGILKLDIVSKSTAAAFHQVDGVTVARKSGKRTGQPPHLWTPELRAEVLALSDRGFTALEIAQQIVVGRNRQVDAQGRLCAVEGSGPFAEWRIVYDAPGESAVLALLKKLRAGAGA